MIVIYQRAEPILMARYKYGTYHKGYFRGGSNIDLNLKKCKDNIVITEILQGYVLYWCHMYILHTGVDRMEAVIRQHLYWPGIRYSVQK